MYQIFSRTWTVEYCGRPRRIEMANTYHEAQDRCAIRNKRVSKKRKAAGFRYEFADAGWYQEAFGR